MGGASCFRAVDSIKKGKEYLMQVFKGIPTCMSMHGNAVILDTVTEKVYTYKFVDGSGSKIDAAWWLDEKQSHGEIKDRKQLKFKLKKVDAKSSHVPEILPITAGIYGKKDVTKKNKYVAMMYVGD